MLAVRRSDSPCRVFLYLYTISDQDGFFELDATLIAEQTGLSRKTVYRAVALLQRVRLLFLHEARTGRGRHSIYKLNWRKSAQNSDLSKQKNQPSEVAESFEQKKCHPCSKRSIKETQESKDAGASKGVHSQKRKQFPASRHQPLDYQGVEAQKVQLIPGARFYRQIMHSIRLGFEQWALSEAHRDALEGFFGNRIDGASLAYARELRDRIWGLRAEIERLAAQGATPRRICSFVTGHLAGVPDRRAHREALKRTTALITDLNQLERRILGLKAWLKERVAEYRAGQICKRCWYQHTKGEYHSGRREDTGELNCFGYARIKLDKLTEALKIKRRTETCSRCGGSLSDGQINGICWSCYAQGCTSPRRCKSWRMAGRVL